METKEGRQRLLSQDGTVLVDVESPPLRPGNPVLVSEVVDSFEEDLSLKEALMFDGGHPDEEGFTLFASSVADWIKKNNWYPVSNRDAQ